MKSSLFYKTINIVASLACIASIGAMEQEFVSSKDFKDLSQSIMMAQGDIESSLKGSHEENECSLKGSQESRGWFSGISDWWNGLDTNVVFELQEGTLTKDLVAQDEKLQKRACDAIVTAIEKKRTENLCTLLNQLNKFEMLSSVAKHNDSIAKFLNTEIVLVCEQKSCSKLMNILQTMQSMQLVVDSASLGVVNDILNEQKARDIQAFKKIYQETNGFVAIILEHLENSKEQHKDSSVTINQAQGLVEVTLMGLEKNKEQYKTPLVEAKDILLLQKYLVGKGTEIKPKIVKEELGLKDSDNALNALLKALKSFADKK